jgi:hypothetical protein
LAVSLCGLRHLLVGVVFAEGVLDHVAAIGERSSSWVWTKDGAGEPEQGSGLEKDADSRRLRPR